MALLPHLPPVEGELPCAKPLQPHVPAAEGDLHWAKPLLRNLPAAEGDLHWAKPLLRHLPAAEGVLAGPQPADEGVGRGPGGPPDIADLHPPKLLSTRRTSSSLMS